MLSFKWMKYTIYHTKVVNNWLQCPEDPTKTVFAIMVSSLQKRWSCIVRLLPCASLSAEKIFTTVNLVFEMWRIVV